MIVETDAYCRYSSNMQDEGNSIEYQVEEIEAYCEKNGMVIRRWYIDKAKTAKQVAGRDEFYELLDDIKNGRSAPNLVVWRTNRAFRNSYESHKYRKLLREHNIKLHSVTQRIDEETSTGRLTTNILSDIDQYKSEEIAEHVTAAMRSMVKKGFYTGQRVPFGYKTVPAFDGDKPRRKYAIDEETAPIVRKCFQDFVDGVMPYTITAWMQQQNIRTSSGKLFDYDALRRMLQNEFYIGTREYKVKGQEPLIIPNAVPAIIDDYTFKEAQRLFIERRRMQPLRGRKSQDVRRYYLTGRAFCAKCEGTYVGKASNGYPYYVCSKKLRRRECDGKGIQKKHIEKAVFDAIQEHVFSEQAVNEIVLAVLNDLEKNPATEVKTKDEYKKRKGVLTREIAELTQMKLDGDINREVFISLKKPKEDELAEVELNLMRIEQQNNVVIDESYVRAYLEDLFRKVESGDEDLIQFVVENTVDHVIISDREVEIYLALSFASNKHRGKLALPNWSLCLTTEIAKLKK